MNIADIKTKVGLKLRPNQYLLDPDKVFGYQRRMVLMMLAYPRMVNGDDVGIGKTIESVVHYTYVKTREPNARAIVFTERNALKQWVAEFKLFAPLIKTEIITATTHEDPRARAKALRQCTADVLISTYSTAYNNVDYIIQGRGPNIVLYADEPYYFKNEASKIHHKIRYLSSHCTRAYGLTATFIENKIEEGMAILQAIAPGQVMPMKEFHTKFCRRQKIRPHVYITVGYKHLDIWRQSLDRWYYGRLQEDPEVLQDLPEVIPKDVELEMSEAQSWKVVEAMDKIIEMPSGETKQLQVLQAVTISQQLVNDPTLLKFDVPSVKLEVLVEMLGGSLLGHSTVVFSKFVTMIDKIAEALKKAKLPFVRITGAEDDAEREDAKRRFMTDDPQKRIPILLITRAGQRAANLQAGAFLIFYDLPWSYGAYKQTVGRVKRTGSRHSKVGVFRFLTVLHRNVATKVGGNKTIDHYGLGVVLKKKALSDVVTGDTTDLDTSASDIMEIFKEIKAGWRHS